MNPARHRRETLSVLQTAQKMHMTSYKNRTRLVYHSDNRYDTNSACMSESGRLFVPRDGNEDESSSLDFFVCLVVVSALCLSPVCNSEIKVS